MVNIYCINLDKRIDRWNIMQKQFSNIKNINLVRIPAIEYRYGWIGCGLSHLKAIDSYMNQNEYLIVIEDDCVITDLDNFDNNLNKLIGWLSENNDKWEIFNGNPSFIDTTKSKILDKTNKIIECKGGTMNFVIYNTDKKETIIKEMDIYRKNLQIWINNIEKNNIKIPHSHKHLPIVDKFVPKNFICITQIPYLTSQFASMSDNETKYTDYNNCLKKSENELLNLINK